MAFDQAWFLASPFGAKFTELTAAQYDYALALAESELASVLCWCPKLYPHALAIKIALILDAASMGTVQDLPPTVAAPGGNYEAYVQEDEVFDVRRKYKIVERSQQIATASPADQLKAIIDRCKPPLRVGAFLGGRLGSMFGGCCQERGDAFGDKAEWNHGGQTTPWG